MNRITSWLWSDKKNGHFSGTIFAERLIYVILISYILTMIVFSFNQLPINLDLGQFIAYVWLMARGAYLGKRVTESFENRNTNKQDILSQMMQNAGAASRSVHRPTPDTQDPEESVRSQKL